MVFKSSNMQAVAFSGWTCLNLAWGPLFSFCLHSCTDAFQRQTLFLESGTGHSRVGPSQTHVCFAQGLVGERSMFHVGCVFCPSVVSLAEFFLFNKCTASSHHTADRNGQVSFFTSWFIFTTVHEIDTHKLVSFSVSSWHASYRVVFSVEGISVIVAGFSRRGILLMPVLDLCIPLCCCFYYPFLLAKDRRASSALCDCLLKHCTQCEPDIRCIFVCFLAKHFIFSGIQCLASFFFSLTNRFCKLMYYKY